MSDYNQNLVFNDLGTFTLLGAAPFAGIFQFDGKISLPLLRDGAGASACLALVKKNGSTQYTGTAGDEGFSTKITLAAGDAVTVVLSSSNSNDNQPNAIKTNVAVFLA